MDKRMNSSEMKKKVDEMTNDFRRARFARQTDEENFPTAPKNWERLKTLLNFHPSDSDAEID